MYIYICIKKSTGINYFFTKKKYSNNTVFLPVLQISFQQYKKRKTLIVIIYVCML